MARFNLGSMYKDGEGVLRDYVQAHMWLSLAAADSLASGNKLCGLGYSDRKTVAEQMTPDQIAVAQRLAREWLAAHSKQ